MGISASRPGLLNLARARGLALTSATALCHKGLVSGFTMSRTMNSGKGVPLGKPCHRALCALAAGVLLGVVSCGRPHSAEIPKSSDGVDHYNRAMEAIGAEQWEDAVQELRQAVRLDPKDAAAHFQLGYAYRELKRYPEAAEEFQQAIRLEPGDGQASFQLGLVKLNRAISRRPKLR